MQLPSPKLKSRGVQLSRLRNIGGRVAEGIQIISSPRSIPNQFHWIQTQPALSHGPIRTTKRLGVPRECSQAPCPAMSGTSFGAVSISLLRSVAAGLAVGMGSAQRRRKQRPPLCSIGWGPISIATAPSPKMTQLSRVPSGGDTRVSSRRADAPLLGLSAFPTRPGLHLSHTNNVGGNAPALRS